MNSTSQYQRDAFQKLLNNNELFSSLNESDKEQTINFFNTIQSDFDLGDSGYTLEKVANTILAKPNKYTSYSSVFSVIYGFGIKMHTNDEEFEALIKKYSHVCLDLPFETSISKCSLANYIYRHLTDRSKFMRNNMSCVDVFNMLKIVVKYLPKTTGLLMTNSNQMDLHSLEFFDKVMADDFESVDVNEDEDDNLSDKFSTMCDNNMLNMKIFKLLLENSAYSENDFDKLLTFLYCRDDTLRLQIIKKIRPSLLSVNIDQLSKIIFYGRSDILQFIIDNIPDQFNQITQNNNPYDIESCNTKIDYIKDIWDGWSWYNDECDKPCIGCNEFNKVQKLMSENSSCVMTDDIIKSWLKFIIGCSRRYDCTYYFVDKSELISMLSLKYETKDDIKQMVNIVGSKIAWDILKKRDDSILQLLLE